MILSRRFQKSPVHPPSVGLPRSSASYSVQLLTSFLRFFTTSLLRHPTKDFKLVAFVQNQLRTLITVSQVRVSRQPAKLVMSRGPPNTFEAVSSIDNDPEKSILDEDKKQAKVTVRSRNSSCSSLGLSIKTPRTARFVEATSVNSPIDPSATGRSPFADPPQTRYLMPQPQPSDVGFGYMSDNQASKHASYAGVEVPLTPASPLKSALKVPGTPGRLNPLSPTFREEQVLEKHEVYAEKRNAADLVGDLQEGEEAA